MSETTKAVRGFRLSHQQRALWLAAPEGGGRRARLVLEAEGPLDAAGLERTAVAALGRIAARHGALRSRFQSRPGIAVPVVVIDETPRVEGRIVEPDAATAADPVESLLGLPIVARGEALGGGEGPPPAADRPQAGAEATDADAVPAVAVLPAGDDRHLLLLDLPALCADRASLEVVFHELAAELADLPGGDASRAEEEAIQYVQVSEWQHQVLQGDEVAEARRYWEGLGLAELDPPVLPAAAAVLPGVGGAEERHREHRLVGSDSLAAIDSAAAALGVDRERFLLAAWFAFLARLTERRRLRVDLAVAGRDLEELSEVVGPLGRRVPVVVDGEPRTPFRSLVLAVQARVEEALLHQDFVLLPESGAVIPPAGGLRFTHSTLPEPRQAGALRLRPRAWRVDDDAAVGVELLATGCPDGLRLELAADSRSAVPALATSWLAGLETLLAAAAAQPTLALEELPMVAGDDREALRLDGGASAAAGDERVHEAVARQAARRPDAVAVMHRGDRVTYGELEAWAEGLADRLGAVGVGVEDRVAILLPRGAAAVAAILGVLKAGAAYVPLDPEQPDDRLRSMLEDSACAALLTLDEAPSRELGGGLPILSVDRSPGGGDARRASRSAAVPRRPRPPASAAAYVVFTSGSSGRPKGVVVEHRQIAAYVAGLFRRLESHLPEHPSFAIVSTFAADLGYTSLFGALCGGGSLLVIDEEQALDAKVLASLLSNPGVDVLKIVPSHLRALCDAGSSHWPLPRRCLVLGGEATPPAFAEELRQRAPGLVVINHYGPTETTVGATTWQLADAVPAGCRSLPIGCPLPGVVAQVVDRRGGAVALGMPGELRIGGGGVARGYVGRPAATADRFVPDPAGQGPGARLYRTGDRVRRVPGAGLEFLGRVDHQLKVRGHRIEPAEVEEALLTHPGVAEAVVVGRDDGSSGLHLVAYVVPRRWARPEIEGRPRLALPNGLAVVQQNRNETEYLYGEIFEGRCYGRNGVRLRRDPVVVDVGGNIGMFTLWIALHRPEAHIVTFEPLEPLFETLRLNAELYAPRARVFPFGLSDAERQVRFTYYPRHTMMSGQSDYAAPELEARVVRRTLENARDLGSAEAEALLRHAEDLVAERFEGQEHLCRLRPLSTALREAGIERVDLLKVDAQRAELDVLRGLEAEDWGRIDQIVLEVHDLAGEATEGRLGELVALLEENGFVVHAEQDELLRGTDRHNVYAVRRGVALEGDELLGVPSPAQPFHPLDPEGVREHLRHRLPEVMWPTVLVPLDALPLGSNGKVDRGRLPAPPEPGRDEEHVEPRTPMERVVAAIWSEVLGREGIGAGANFFALGGHSLLATQIISRLRERTGVDVPLRALFRNPTVEGLARVCDDASQVAGDEPALVAGAGLEEELARLEGLSSGSDDGGAG